MYETSRQSQVNRGRKIGYHTHRHTDTDGTTERLKQVKVTGPARGGGNAQWLWRRRREWRAARYGRRCRRGVAWGRGEGDISMTYFQFYVLARARLCACVWCVCVRVSVCVRVCLCVYNETDAGRRVGARREKGERRYARVSPQGCSNN